MRTRWTRIGLVLTMLLIPAATVLAQSFATPIGVVQAKAWLFDSRGKAAKLGKATFVLGSGELERLSGSATAASVIPAYAFAAINSNTFTLLNNAIKTCKLIVKGSGKSKATCQKFSQTIQGVNVVGWVAFVPTPMTANGKLTAIVKRKGGGKSAAGTVAADVMVWLNNDAATTPEQARDAAIEAAMIRLREEANRVRERPLIR